jgi:DNA-binding YbaB/EbfC family protein
MNIQKMLKQAQQMQAKMAQAQEELAQKTVEATAADGKVKVVANGNGEVVSLSIDPTIVDPEDVEFLQDLILSTVQKAIESGKELAAEEMSKLTGGLNIPGMPF